MDFNVATTISFCGAAISVSVAVLGAYMGQRPATRHFRWVALAGAAAAVYCLTDAVLAGSLAPNITIWAGRVSAGAVGVHAAAWLLTLAAWDKRAPTRGERLAILGSVSAGFACLAPGIAVQEGVTVRSLRWLGVVYHDPVIAPVGVVLVGFCYAAHVAAALTAWRMRRRHPRAKAVAIGLSVFCIVIPIDSLSAIQAVNLPYLADLAIAFVLMSIGSVVVRDAADTADKSAELDRARIALAERDNLAALGQLAAVMAHEVRNPVAIIVSALATLRRSERSSAEDESLLGIIGEEAERLKQLVTRLLDAVRPFELQYSSRAVDEVVRMAIAQVTTSKGVAESQIEIETLPNEEVECDEVLLVQALSNLVQNAVIANGRRSPVRVRAAVEAAAHPVMLRVDVIDDGEGVPPEARERLFTPFFTTRATGTGLGLALVRRIAGAHGGTVEYAPPPAGGACFIVRVPLRAKDAVPRRLVGNDVR